MTKDEALALALEALEESVDLVRDDYENAKIRHGNYPSRQARLLGMEDGLSKHEKAITAIKQTISAPVQEPMVSLTIEYEPGYPEEVAFGTQRQMDRLKKWLDKYFAMIAVAAIKEKNND